MAKPGWGEAIDASKEALGPPKARRTEWPQDVIGCLGAMRERLEAAGISDFAHGPEALAMRLLGMESVPAAASASARAQRLPELVCGACQAAA